MVRPSHVAAPDLPGRGLPEISPAFLGTWGPRFRNSTRRVRRPRSQLSDPARMPRPPEGKRGDYELRDAKGLDTLAGGTPICMYRQSQLQSSPQIEWSASSAIFCTDSASLTLSSHILDLIFTRTSSGNSMSTMPLRSSTSQWLTRGPTARLSAPTA
jgi:hypothetical protein